MEFVCLLFSYRCHHYYCYFVYKYILLFSIFVLVVVTAIDERRAAVLRVLVVRLRLRNKKKGGAVYGIDFLRFSFLIHFPLRELQ